MDRSREQSQYFRSFVPEELRRCSSFRDYLRLFFGDKFGSLRLIDLATGNGRFPLVVARQKRSLGVVEIVASDKDLSFIEKSGNRQRLEKAGVVIERRDVEQVYKDERLAGVLWGDQVEELPDNQRYDVVCLNAP